MKTTASFCGLDFGTSNTTIGTVSHQGLQLIPLENNKNSIRSAIFCDAELKKLIFGQEGVNRYLEETHGRLLMALKSVLGTTLMDEETLIFNEFISYKSILGKFIKHIKTIAETHSQKELTHVVMGRPVRFHDTDLAQDKKAQQTLEEIALDVGFEAVLFQYEPIAAALAYEANISEEQLALIVDMGGGTSDFSVIRLTNQKRSDARTDDVLANSGIHIAGTDFDHHLSMKTVMPLLGLGSTMYGSSSLIEVPNYFYHDLTTWYTLSSLYSAKNLAQLRSIQTVAQDKKLIARLIQVIEKRRGHHLLNAVEMAKQQLSELDHLRVGLPYIEAELEIEIARKTLNEVISSDIEKIIATITATLHQAGIKSPDIDAVFYTGGSTNIPCIRDRINSLFPNARIVLGDAFGSVGLGLSIDASRRF